MTEWEFTKPNDPYGVKTRMKHFALDEPFGLDYMNKPDDVVKTKKAMGELGYYKIKDPKLLNSKWLDSSLGAAVKKFQKDNALSVDGRMRQDGPTALTINAALHHTREGLPKSAWMQRKNPKAQGLGLKASVGKSGHNDPDDVKKISKALAALHLYPHSEAKMNRSEFTPDLQFGINALQRITNKPIQDNIDPEGADDANLRLLATPILDHLATQAPQFRDAIPKELQGLPSGTLARNSMRFKDQASNIPEANRTMEIKPSDVDQEDVALNNAIPRAPKPPIDSNEEDQNRDISPKANGQSDERAAYDLDFIYEEEGKILKEGYVPEDGQEIPFPKSGVTIGAGVDLGQLGEHEFNQMAKKHDIPKELADRLRIYLGKKGQEASDYLRKNPLEVSDEEAKLITKVKYGIIYDRLERLHDKEVSEGAFAKLPYVARTVALSVATQYGEGLKREDVAPKFWKHLVNKDWDGMIGELRNFGDIHDKRREKEASELEKEIQSMHNY